MIHASLKSSNDVELFNAIYQTRGGAREAQTLPTFGTTKEKKCGFNKRIIKACVSC